jgi:hypothetical protein
MTSPQLIELDARDNKDETTSHAVSAHEDQLERAEVKDDSATPRWRLRCLVVPI